MATNTPYIPVITQGAGGGFNPKCNQKSGAQFASPSIPSAAEVAQDGMRKKAAERVSQEAYRRAKEAEKDKPSKGPKRWLSNDDLT